MTVLPTPRFEVLIAARVVLTPDVVALDLMLPDRRKLPPFAAGAHIDIEVADGLVRQYSLCNSPAERHRYTIAVLREAESRGGSAAVHDFLHVGDRVQISEPRNHFPLVGTSGRSLLFAGGIGITPILSMAEHLAQVGNEFALHYCCRLPDRVAFHDRLTCAPFASRVDLHLDSGPPEQRLDMRAVLGSYGAGDQLYVCGPSGFIDHVLTSARAQGWPDSALHHEYFVPPATNVQPIANGSFEIRLARSGMTLSIPPDRTVVDVLSEAGVEVPMSCEQGVCGTCLTAVLAGEPDHRDYFLSDEEHAANDQFTPCCSRSKSPLLVLDL